MITKQEFNLAAKSVTNNFAVVLPLMINYKSNIQKAIINAASRQELEDIFESRINQGLINKLCKLAKNEWLLSENTQSLYCAAIAVATIIKEYDWGAQYLVGDGMWEIAQRIQNA